MKSKIRKLKRRERERKFVLPPKTKKITQKSVQGPGLSCVRFGTDVRFVCVSTEIKTRKNPKQMTSSRCGLRVSRRRDRVPAVFFRRRKKLQRATPILLPVIVVSQTEKPPKKNLLLGLTGTEVTTPLSVLPMKKETALAPLWIEKWTQQTSNRRVTRRAIRTV